MAWSADEFDPRRHEVTILSQLSEGLQPLEIVDE